jgi:hypothetical protein
MTLTTPQRQVLQRLWLTRNAFKDVGLRRRASVTNVLNNLQRLGLVYKECGYPWSLTTAGEQALRDTPANGS